MHRKKVDGAGPLDAKVMLVGEAPGKNEEERGFPFCGSSGLLLNEVLQQAGFDRQDLRIVNVCRYRPPGNKIDAFFLNKTEAKKQKVRECMGRYPSDEILEGMKELYDEIDRVKPDMIIVVGNTSLWALTGEQGITKWRGSMLNYKLNPSIRVLPTYHPAGVMRMWKWKPILVHDLKRAYEYRDKPWPDPNYNFTIAKDIDTTLQTLYGLRQQLENSKESYPISCDIETRAQHIACIGLGWSAKDAITIPLFSFDRPSGFWDYEEEFLIVRELKRILTHPNAAIIGQNFLYDEQYLARYWGIKCNVDTDTMWAQHLLIPGEMPKGLDFLSSMYCKYHRYWKDEGKELDKNFDEEQWWEYNCKDAVTTWEVAQVLRKQIRDAGLEEQYQEMMDFYPRLLRAMLRGVKRHSEKQGQLAIELQGKLSEYQAWFNRIMPEGIMPEAKTPWYDSSQQIQKLFYKALGFSPILHPQRKRPTADDEALRKIAKREPAVRPLCENLLRYRQLKVFFGTFVGAKADHDGRFRSSYGLAESFRLTSSKDAFGFGLNLQNIPAGDESD